MVSEIKLTQNEADRLIALEKHCEYLALGETQPIYSYPSLGGKLAIPLICLNKKENFMLDIYRNKIMLTKETRQLRGRQIIPLLRLDTGGAPHTNPDGEEIPSPHLHIYREGYGDKFAVYVPSDKFLNLTNSWETLWNFMTFCNVKKPPQLNPELWVNND